MEQEPERLLEVNFIPEPKHIVEFEQMRESATASVIEGLLVEFVIMG